MRNTEGSGYSSWYTKQCHNGEWNAVFIGRWFFSSIVSSSHNYSSKTYFKWFWYLKKLAMCSQASQAGLGKLSASFETFESLLQCWWLVGPASLPVCWLLPVWFLKLWERNHFLGARKMAQELRTLVFAGDPGLAPSTHILVHNRWKLQFWGSDAFFWPLWAPTMSMVHTHTCRQWHSYM